ncbi:MAG TPA: type IX secretion system outer membrane channel protein PorV [Cytophagaceae bacterium]|jgi:hypothetical protein
MKKSTFFYLTITLSFIYSSSIFAQQDSQGKDGRRIISTAVPIFVISPDARSGALGDAGVAITPDANSIYWNPAKLAFIEKDMGFALSYTPWLRKLVGDMSLSYLTGYKKLSKEEAIGVSFNYFSMGKIAFIDEYQNPQGEGHPYELALGGTYSRKLSENLSLALSLKFIHSNLAGGVVIPNSNAPKAANTAAGDLGVYYKKDLVLGATNSNIAFGAMISNVGPRISYTNNNERGYIPTNLKIGTAFTVELDPYNKMTFTVDANKLMVPTPPERDNKNNIINGKDPNRPVLSGIFGSFGDAPYGASEELREVILCGGVEYWYNNLFAARGGFFNENKFKGNRKYFTVGFGVKYQAFGLDFAYLVPIQQNNPLAETLRFSLSFDIESKQIEESVIE